MPGEEMVHVTIEYPDGFVSVGGDKCKIKLVPNPKDPNGMLAQIVTVTDKFGDDVTEKRLRGYFQ